MLHQFLAKIFEKTFEKFWNFFEVNLIFWSQLNAKSFLRMLCRKLCADLHQNFAQRFCGLTVELNGTRSLILNGRQYDFVPANFWIHQLTVWYRKLLNQIFRRIALRAFSRKIDLMSPTKLSAEFRFFQFPVVASLSHRYQDCVKAALACFETRWNATRDTRRPSFGAKSGASVAKPRFWIWKPWLSSFERAINRLSN